MNEITRAYLRARFSYSKKTGEIKSKKSGNVLGTIDEYGYRRITIGRKKYRAHRLIWIMVTGKPPSNDIDHKNGIRDDNRFSNLRDATRFENSQNRRYGSATNNKYSELLGVSYRKQRDKWISKINILGKQIHLGSFDSAEGAHLAYVAAKRAMHVGCTI